MRTEPVKPVQPKPAQRDEPAPAAPRRDGRLAFESALRRAGRGPQGDASEEPAAVAMPDAALPRQRLAGDDTPAPRWTPLGAPAADAAAQRLRAAADSGPTPGRWQLQIVEPGRPAQTLEVQRSAAGPLTVLLAAAPAGQQSASTARLRQRLARGASAARLEFRPPDQEDDA